MEPIPGIPFCFPDAGGQAGVGAVSGFLETCFCLKAEITKHRGKHIN